MKKEIGKKKGIAMSLISNLMRILTISQNDLRALIISVSKSRK